MIFYRIGLQHGEFLVKIVSDNGPQSLSRECELFMKVHGIEHKLTPIYSPQSNGAVERLSQTIKNLVQGGLKDGFQWKENLSNVLLAIRSTPHSTTKETPFKLMTGRDMRVKLSTLQPPNLQGKKLQRTDVVRKAVEEVQKKAKSAMMEKLQLRKAGLKVILCAPNCHYKKEWKANIQSLFGSKELRNPPLPLWMVENGILTELCCIKKKIILFHGSQRTS